ncbi:hypothetical protein ScPMuIL_004125 [Solemya velum]
MHTSVRETVRRHLTSVINRMHNDYDHKQPKEPDVYLKNAVEKCIHGDSLMPLVKEELKCRIQIRRLSKGQSEIVLESEAAPAPAPAKHPLTEEEVFKKNARRRQNRESATRSRAKERQRIAHLLERVSQLEASNNKLLHSIEVLREQITNKKTKENPQ